MSHYFKEKKANKPTIFYSTLSFEEEEGKKVSMVPEIRSRLT